MSGQLSERAGMGIPLSRHPLFGPLRGEYDALTGGRFGRWVTKAPQEEISDKFTAPATMVLYDCLCGKVAMEEWGPPAAVAGYSLGFYAAAIMSGCIGEGPILQWMDRVNACNRRTFPAGAFKMAAVTGLSRPDLLRRLGEWELGRVEVANMNNASQVIVAGPAEEVGQAIGFLKGVALDVREVPLDIPLHTSHVEPARREVEAWWAAVPACSPSLPLISPVDGRLVEDGAAFKAHMLRSLVSPTNWQAVVERIREMGVAQRPRRLPRRGAGPHVQVDLPGDRTPPRLEPLGARGMKVQSLMDRAHELLSRGEGPRSLGDLSAALFCTPDGPVARGIMGPLLVADGRFRLEGEMVWLAPEDNEPSAVALPELNFCVLDFETNGFAPGDRAIEIGISRWRGGEENATFESLLDPGTGVSPFVTRLTGIRGGDLEGQPAFPEILPRVMEMLEDAVLVAHNLPFDGRILESEIARAGVDKMLRNSRVCTLKLARRLLPKDDPKNLDALAERFGLQFLARHRALGDARVTGALLHKLLQLGAESRPLETLGDLQSLLAGEPARAEEQQRAKPGL